MGVGVIYHSRMVYYGVKVMRNGKDLTMLKGVIRKLMLTYTEILDSMNQQ